MGDKIKFSSFFAEGQYATQVETLEIVGPGKGVRIGIPKENHVSEHRVSLAPNSIRSIIGYGHTVIVESKAGDAARYSDDHYRRAGAEVTKDPKSIYLADIIIRISPPSIEELDLMKPGQILISTIPLPVVDETYLNKLKEKRITAMAMEHIEDSEGQLPIVRMMSEMAGNLAVLTASELLSTSAGGRGVIMGGVSGVPPTKVVVLGASHAGEYAVRTALGLGASVRIFDNDINKIIRLQNSVGRQLHTSSINPEYIAYQLTSADVVIAALYSKNGRSPIIVTEEMVSNMKKGSVIIDLSIDQGGCIESSEMTTHSKPTYSKYDVTHYCVPNISSKVPRTSSAAISNILTPIILTIGAQRSTGDLLRYNDGIRRGVYTYEGHLTKEYLAKRFSMKYTALELILPSQR